MSYQPYGQNEAAFLFEWGDEFNAFDDAKWLYRVGSGPTQASHQTASAVTFADFNAIITVKAVSPQVAGKDYTAGGLIVEDAFAPPNTAPYFYAEAKILLCGCEGVHDAFWYSSRTVDDTLTYIAELDVFEFEAADSVSTIPIGIFQKSPGVPAVGISTNPGNPHLGDLTLDYHVFATWHRSNAAGTGGIVSYYCDGICMATYNYVGIPRTLGVILSTIITSSSLLDLNIAKLPVQMKIDWFRSYVQVNPKRPRIYLPNRAARLTSQSPHAVQLMRQEQIQNNIPDPLGGSRRLRSTPRVIRHQYEHRRHRAAGGAPIAVQDTYQTLVTTLPGGAPHQLLALPVGDGVH